MHSAIEHRHDVQGALKSILHYMMSERKHIYHFGISAGFNGRYCFWELDSRTLNKYVTLLAQQM